MRLSTAQLVNTAIRLADLRFPASRVHVTRTRLAYLHLDNLLHFAKIDRDGRIDGYVAAFLPDEVALLFLRKGEVVTATALTEQGRRELPIATALQYMHNELERGELTYCEAPLEQLQWMYASCTKQLVPRPVQAAEPWLLFKALKHERSTGILELISGGRVTYLRFEDGTYQNGYFCGKADDLAVSQYVEQLMKPRADGELPGLAAALFEAVSELPQQAPPAMLEMYHQVFWRIIDAAEGEVPGDASRKALALRDALGNVHTVLLAIGRDRNEPAEPVVAQPRALTFGLSDWAAQLLEQIEVMAPGAAPDILRQATREHRYVLQKDGFYDRLPWSVSW